ncbi:MAG: lamin tail domain-containing protein [Saprospiraceae bacterium]|nr:lamin tail domain-containing protein [Saprospiraceae bacterium]
MIKLEPWTVKFYYLVGFLLLWLTASSQVVINELMADPSPPASLVEEEYVELLNISSESVSLAGWALSDASSTQYFGDENLSPYEYVIVCSAEHQSQFEAYGRVVPLPSLPSLNNSGDEITLWNADNEIVDQVVYSSAWYNDALRDDGGYSLERTNPNNFCDTALNWRASLAARGGSPGQENANYDPLFYDDSPLQVLFAEVLGDSIVHIQFNKKLDLISATSILHYSSPGLGIAETVVILPDSRSVVVEFAAALLPQTVYTIQLSNIEDCHQLNTLSTEIITGLPETPSFNDLIINEILFNPKSGGVDYIEVYNNSQKIIAADELIILELDPITSELLDMEAIENSHQLLLPGSYWVFTSNPDIIEERFQPAHTNQLIESNIPNYPDEMGSLAILNAQLDTLDQVTYSADWHFDLISEEDGVALERISTAAASQDPQNWFSAAFTSNNGTPTAINSQIRPEYVDQSKVFLSSEVFSPDLDGVNDLLTITIQQETTVTATIAVYNLNGNVVRMLVNNQLLGYNNEVIWDGLGDNRNELPIGHYIVLASWFDEEGNSAAEKIGVVLSRKRF